MDFCKARGVTAGCLFCQQPLAKSQGVTGPASEAPLVMWTPKVGHKNVDDTFRRGCIRGQLHKASVATDRLRANMIEPSSWDFSPTPPYINAWIPSASLQE